MSQIAFDLIHWYRQNQRDLPFRLNRDPYRVWISEIMAQQTQIDTLIPYYQRWMDRFPNMQSVALADEASVLKAWEGLGYYSRARNLRKAAQHILDFHNGIFPTRLADIQALPGIGPYTASAIASICFETPTAAIDGNVKRVMSRLFCLSEEKLKSEFTVRIATTIETWMQSVSPNELTQALMELGALVCQKQAKCESCPLSIHCLAKQSDQVNLYPSVKKKAAKKIESLEVVLILTPDRKIALTKHHQDALMKGYYRLPLVSQTNLDIQRIKKDRVMSHVFTHKIWNVTFYEHMEGSGETLEWFDLEALKGLPLITLHRQYLESKALEIDL